MSAPEVDGKKNLYFYSRHISKRQPVKYDNNVFIFLLPLEIMMVNIMGLLFPHINSVRGSGTHSIVHHPRCFPKFVYVCFYFIPFFSIWISTSSKRRGVATTACVSYNNVEYGKLICLFMLTFHIYV